MNVRAEPGLGARIASGYLYLAVAGAMTLFVVPRYLATLGVAIWGDIAWCLTFQGLLFATDMAIGPLLLRDAARAAADGEGRGEYLRYLRLYAAVATVVVLVAAAVLMPYARHASLSPDLRAAIVFALAQFFFQFCNLAAIGLWNAQGRQHAANLRLASFLVAKHALALCAVQLAPGATAYMAAFAWISAIECLFNAMQARRDGTRTGTPRVDDATPMRWREFAAFASASALALIGAQVDRLYLSLALPRATFGIYFLVGSLMLAVLHLQLPLQRVFVPRIAVAADPHAAALQMLKIGAVLLALPSLLLAANAERALALWLADATIAAEAARPFAWLLVAAALIVLASPMQALLLGAGRYRTMAAIHGTALVAQVFTLWWLLPAQGMLAGAAAWVVAALVQGGAALWLWRMPAPTRA
jgi:O-antigen/teichoic acid export membrane protein